MIQEIREELETWAAIVASLAGIVVCRKWIVAAWNWIVCVYTRPARIEASIDRITYALFNDGNGMEAQLARLSGCHTVAFENAPYPAFECNADGKNSRVNLAYRRLLGISVETHNTGNRWHQAVYGDLANEYHAEFERCALEREDFIGSTDIRNPITGEHRGRWKIHAPCIQVGKSCIFIGRFIAALDAKAQAITIAEDWECR